MDQTSHGDAKSYWFSVSVEKHLDGDFGLGEPTRNHAFEFFQTIEGFAFECRFFVLLGMVHKHDSQRGR